MILSPSYKPYSKMAAIIVFFCFQSCKLALSGSFLNSKFSFQRGNKGLFTSKQNNTKIATMLEYKVYFMHYSAGWERFETVMLSQETVSCRWSQSHSRKGMSRGMGRETAKFITCVARLSGETNAGNNRLFSVVLPYCPLEKAVSLPNKTRTVVTHYKEQLHLN